jgi:hypothetical protein
VILSVGVGIQVTADLVHYHLPVNMGNASFMNAGYPGIVAAAAAAAAAARASHAASVEPQERTPEPETRSATMMRIEHYMPLFTRPVRSVSPEALGSTSAAENTLPRPMDTSLHAGKVGLDKGQVTAELVNYHRPLNGETSTSLARGTGLANSSSLKGLAAIAEARRIAEMTPEPKTRPGSMKRVGFSLPLPVRSPPPEAAGEVASAAEEILLRPSEPDSSEVIWRALARGETAPPGDLMNYRVRAAHLFLPVRTPEPENLSSQAGDRLEIRQTITPLFAFSPKGPGRDVS